MKGIVFCEFIDMVEARFSLELADRIISSCALATGGAYTAMGDYDHRELVVLVERLSEATATPAPALLRGFGEHLLRRFTRRYPEHFSQHSAFELLGVLDSKIHLEVAKLYPEAELPVFQHEYPAADRMVLLYSSRRPFADLAEGLIRGCIDHFGERIALSREDLPCAAGARARFTLTR
jgi:hypothetical protein